MDNIKCINKYRAYVGSKKENARLYSIRHRDKVNEYARKYRANREPVECECGLTYSYHHKNRHKKSKRHIKRMLEINN